MPYFLCDRIGDGSDTEGNQFRPALALYSARWAVAADIPGRAKMIVRAAHLPALDGDARILPIRRTMLARFAPDDGETDDWEAPDLAAKFVRRALLSQILGADDFGIDLDGRLSALPAARRQRIRAALLARGIDLAELTLSTSIGDALRFILPRMRVRLDSRSPRPSGTFTDDFTNAGSSNVQLESHTPSGGTAWVRVDGNASAAVVSPADHLFDTSGGAQSSFVCDDQAAANQYTQANTKGANTAGFGLCNRLTNANNFLGVQTPTGGTAKLFKRVAGTFTQLGSSGANTLAVDDLLRFESDGDAHEVFLNAVSEIGPVNDAFNNTETRQGVVARAGSTIAWIDNFEAGVLAGDAPTGDIVQTLPALTQAASGVMQPAGAIAQTLPSLTQAASGEATGQDVSGTIAQTLPSVSQAATAVMQPSGSIVQTLPSLTQAASASIPDDDGIYVNDTFTEASNTALESHTPDTGSAWEKQSGFSAGATVSSSTGKVSGDSTSTAVYRNTTTLGTDDYEVVATVRRSASNGIPGLIARASDSVGSFYWFFLNSTAPTFQKLVNGSATVTLNQTGITPANDVDYELRLRVDGNRISCFVDGELVLTYFDQSSPHTTGQPGLMCRSTSTVDDYSVIEIGALDTVVHADGVWTWFNDPRAIFHDGKYYIGSMSSLGDVQVVEYDPAAGDTYRAVLAAAFEVDDHDNPGIVVLPSGKIACFYAEHNDDGTVYRVSTNAGDITAFDAAQDLGSLQTSMGSKAYANPFYLSDASKLALFYRSGFPEIEVSALGMLSANADLSSWDSEVRIAKGSSDDVSPYYKFAQNGNGRVDVLITDSHPDQQATSLYHFYVEWNAGSSSFKFYTSDGTEITATRPWRVNDEATLIYDGSTISSWNWDIRIDGDGNPRVLFATFPDSATDHRYNFARWNGAAWTTPVEISPGGAYLTSGEPHYSGGATFDGNNTDIVYLSVQSGAGKHEIQEWRTADNGATWAKETDITSSSIYPQGRPYSPDGHDGNAGVIWWGGNYLSFTSYGSMSVKRFANATGPAGAVTSTLSAVSQSATAVMEPRGAAVQTLSAPTQAAVAEFTPENIEGAVVATLGAVTQAAAAEMPFRAAAVQTLSVVEQAATASSGSAIATAAQTLSAVTQAATANASVAGQAVNTLARVTQSAIAVVVPRGAVISTLSAVTQLATATRGDVVAPPSQRTIAVPSRGGAIPVRA